MKTFKADLHVHSSHSNKPTYWALRKFRCPESYTSPDFIYRSAKNLGMDYVTISDHNSITGALEIAHLPGTFLSTELTAHFPEDGCKVHVVALHINESIFRDLNQARKNIYELVNYLRHNNIAHFLAHPLYAQNEKLTADHIEKLLLLFDVFETKNGSRARRFNLFFEQLLKSLTPDKMNFLADKHNLHHSGTLSWRKGTVGGSDDHGGLFIGRAYTASARGKTLGEFIGAIKERQTLAEGEDGDSLTLAHSLYGIGHNFYRERFKARMDNSTPFIKALLDRFFGLESDRMSLVEKVRLFIKKNIPEAFDNYDRRSFEEILDREAKRLLNDSAFLKSISAEDRNRKVFAVTSYLANRMIYIYTKRLTKLSFDQGFFEIVNSVSTIGLVHLLVSPYYLAFHHQHRNKDLICELDNRFKVAKGPAKEKIALFTDTLNEINGVAITIKRMIETAKKQGIELTVITSTPAETGFANGVMNFKCLGDVTLPEYPELKLHFPPLLDVIDYFEREGFTRIHVSTPGSIGIVALVISKLMDIPIAGTYHTEIPQYVGKLTNDEFLEQAAWSYMIWFYSQMKEVMVPSASTRAQLIEKGLAADKTKPLPRWVDTVQFSPEKKDPLLWERYRFNCDFKFLYVGRVSREKNLELLAEAFTDLVDSGSTCCLIVVGDGPYLTEMIDRLKGYPVLFTGYLGGEDLAAVYASADLFVFPSATDTFGNVVLEAQASGLPVIVSDEGGPRELLIDGETGIITRAGDKESLVEAMRFFVKNRNARAKMGSEARKFIEAKEIPAGEVYGTILQSELKLAKAS